MEKMHLTKPGLVKLQNELDRLIHQQRPRAIEELVEARESGKSSVSDGYQRAIEAQERIEQRIKELQLKLSNAKVIDSDQLSGTDQVHLGAIVKLKQPHSNKTVEYQIVGDEESDVDNGKISVNSPIAASLIGGHEGDTVVVRAPVGEISFEIVNIRYS